ncbi:hypothetical protein DPPLL_34970 [Desulfofustis limnaeus]|uniref:Uncharacterized protein n=1 Tax=Desulfofustis limnaeus TaxID=2740163 RepID=A0ABM7WDS3_9BACT|nr:hypothetical protein DPPLL_34970 [Desulfofustis limnaeus]
MIPEDGAFTYKKKNRNRIEEKRNENQGNSLFHPQAGNDSSKHQKVEIKRRTPHREQEKMILRPFEEIEEERCQNGKFWGLAKIEIIA